MRRLKKYTQLLGYGAEGETAAWRMPPSHRAKIRTWTQRILLGVPDPEESDIKRLLRHVGIGEEECAGWPVRMES